MRNDHPHPRPPEAIAPTLLVFTRGRREPRRLLPGTLADQEAALHRACLGVALEAGHASGCQTVVCSPDAVEQPSGAGAMAQRGHGFGERLARAVADRFAAGDGAVVVVPSDVPGFTASHLQRAAATLAKDPGAVVVGPSPDGGLYLLGAARPLPFDLLRRVRWCRRDTRRHLLALLAAAGRRVVLLDPLVDLDRPSDLSRWLARPRDPSARWRRFLAPLLAALRALRRPAPLAPCLPSHPSRRRLAGRAPPFLLAS
jgi:glycosyltransferase A (GT-A) superfamily protein (DUF2064 family)